MTEIHALTHLAWPTHKLLFRFIFISSHQVDSICLVSLIFIYFFSFLCSTYIVHEVWNNSCLPHSLGIRYLFFSLSFFPFIYHIKCNAISLVFTNMFDDIDLWSDIFFMKLISAGIIATLLVKSYSHIWCILWKIDSIWIRWWCFCFFSWLCIVTGEMRRKMNVQIKWKEKLFW